MSDRRLLSGTRVCYFGRYDPHNLRNTVIAKCLARAGAEVIAIRDDRDLIRRTPALFRRAHRADFDLILVGFRAHSDVFAARVLARLHGVPLVFDPLTSRYEERVLDRGLVSPRHPLAWWYRAADSAGCRMATRVLLETEAQIDYFVRTFGIPRSRCRRLWLGADDETMRPQPAAPTGAPFTVFFYGRFSPLHGIEHIIEAAARLEQRRDLVRVVIVGGGQTYRGVRALAERLNVSTVQFVDPVSYRELAAMMSAADVCLGTFGTTARAARVIPYKVFDALAVGRPVITADTPAIREALVGGQDVWVCPAGDSEALATAIATLKQDAGLRERLARHGHRVFLDRFSLDALTRDVTAIVTELTGGRREA